jgi:hypothetical protein
MGLRPAVTVSTILTPASNYSLVDLPTLKTVLGVTTTAYDPLFNILIPQASTTAQDYCNNPFVVETIQDQFWPGGDGWPWTVRTNVAPLQLSRRPILNPPAVAGTAAPITPLPPYPPQTSGAAPQFTIQAGGALAAATYYVRLTYVTPLGETALSPEVALPLAASTLFTIPSPVLDENQIATGFNVYVATTSLAETRQNTTPINLGTNWTLPTSGLISGAAPPSAMTVAETIAGVVTPLGEGVDFIVDREFGQLTRLDTYGRPRNWHSDAVLAVYQAGYSTIPGDVFRAVVDLIKLDWYAQARDPLIRSQNVVGVYESSYVMGTGPGGADDMSAFATAKLDRYRIPVVA